MPVDEAPEDDETRESYNFAPGYYGLVYRADVPDYGAGPRRNHNGEEGGDADAADDTAMSGKEVKYKLQAMKWGGWPSITTEIVGAEAHEMQAWFLSGQSATQIMEQC